MAKAKKLPSGSWRALAYIGKDKDGKRKYKSFTASTRKEAEFQAAEYVLSNNSGQSTIDITVGEAINRYISSKENVLSPSTVREYKLERKLFLQDIMSVKIQLLTQEQVQLAVNSDAAKHAPKTVRNAHGLLVAAMKMFVPETNFHTSLPQKIKSNFYIPSDTVIENIRDKIKELPIEIPFLLSSQCGLRPSEISALNINCVSETNIEITQARVRGEKGTTLKPPKTFSGYRSIPAPEALIALLKERATEDGRVCSMSASQISDVWTDFLKKENIAHFRFYALRHYFASKALLLGIPQKYIAEIMGHSSLDMLNKVYQHTFPSAMSEFQELLRKRTAAFMQHEMQHEK
ncbi:site-specific integrase [Clostridium minihomine]|uniref:site-specific integrase n=1 Tax=Clostridium minihomine TaxID=2045012 RepID=UPI0013EAC0FC|nr:site-specific integrase [Clostridium minihomine]